MGQFDERLCSLYHEGKSRQDAMRACKITNTNVMSSTSSRLKLHWSWPLKNRQSGEAPAGKAPKQKAARPVVARANPNNGRGATNFNRAKRPAESALSESERKSLVESIEKPLFIESTPEEVTADAARQIMAAANKA